MAAYLRLDLIKHENLINYILQLPSFVWSEEQQKDLFARHFRAFDILRRKGFFIGEFIWNFADFKTNQCKYNLKHNYVFFNYFFKFCLFYL